MANVRERRDVAQLRLAHHGVELVLLVLRRLHAVRVAERDARLDGLAQTRTQSDLE